MEASARPMTVDEWLLYDVPEGYKAELVDGELEMTPLAAKRHQRVLRRLIEQIVVFTLSNPGVIASWDSPCRFPIPGAAKARGREPDLGIYDRDPPELDDPLAWKQVLPVVVVEVVSPDATEAKRDYADKRRDYFLAGIPEYWIADYKLRLFLALRRTEHGWDERQLEGEGTYTTPLLPGFELPVGKLWT